ncbi:MAG: calcium-binding protein [Geobacteraceae bacterium GWC2_58_44]|nr:MAG: calcium-binding protein [Geobacteraceae bacterium GWC2_58_44]
MKAKMTLAVFLLVVFLMSVTAVTAMIYFEKSFKKNISLQQFALLDSVATQIDERMFDYLVEFDSLADSITPALIADPDQLQRLLDQQKMHRVFFDNSLFLFDRSGMLVAATPSALNFIGKNFSFRDYFQKTVSSGKICISGPFASIQKQSHPIIMFTTPVYDAGNNIIAVLGGSIELRGQRYLRSLAALRLGQKGYLSLYDQSGTVLMHPDKARVLQKYTPGASKLVDKALTGFEGTEESRSAGDLPVLRSVKRLKSTDWLLALSYPLADAYAPVYNARTLFLAGSLAAALLSLLTVWPLMRYLTAPLLSFTRHLEQLPALEWADRPVPVASNDEIGILAQTFNRMLFELEQHKLELQEQKEFAENLVLNSSLPTFVLDPQHKVLIWNQACEELTGVKSADIIGTGRHWSAFYGVEGPSLADVVIDGTFDNLPPQHTNCERSKLLSAGWHCEGWYEKMCGQRRYLFLDAAPIYNDRGELRAVIETIRDITELKQVEQELERSRDFYLTLFDNFPALIWRSGTDSKSDYFNRTWLEFTGRSREQERGTGWAEGVHTEDLDLCMTTYLEAFRARRPFEMEYRLRRHDGAYRWIIDMGRPFNGLDGSFAGYIGTCYDVTDRKEAANKILKLSHVIEQSPNSVVIATLAGSIEYVNPGTSEATGYAVEELVGQDVTLLSPPEAAYEIERALHEVVNHGKEWRGEIPARRKEGEVFWEQVTISPIRSLEGKITHFVSTKEDITQRKQFELSLRESEERYRRLFENNPHPMWAYDLETLRFLAVNHAAVLHYGYSREEFLAMTINDILPPQEVPALIDAVATPPEMPEAASLRRHMKSDGSVIVAEVTSHLLQFSGREAEIVQADDVTEKIRAEEEKSALEHQLAQSQKMEAIGTLTGGIAHDFNNILTAIVGYATLIQMEIGNENPLHRKVSQILSASERAANLIHSLLAYSRKQPSKTACVGLNSIVAGIEPLLRRVIPENIEFVSRLAEADLTIMADSGQVEQVLMNLIVNARDAMCGGGEMRVATEPITLDRNFITTHGYGSAGSYALLTVSDSGVGMEEKTRNRIFEPFFTTKEVGKGTGLGLAMVYGIVKQHNGFINCYSEPGHGTVFRIYLPLADGPVHEAIETAHQDLAGGGESILLVEDDEVLREMVAELLEGFGYTVIKAVDGADAVQKFQEVHREVQLVILDMILPKMNGWEVYQVMSELSPGVKALFMSGYTTDMVTAKLIGEDPRCFVTKPIGVSDLLGKVRSLLDDSPSPPTPTAIKLRE